MKALHCEPISVPLAPGLSGGGHWSPKPNFSSKGGTFPWRRKEIALWALGGVTQKSAYFDIHFAERPTQKKCMHVHTWAYADIYTMYVSDFYMGMWFVAILGAFFLPFTFSFYLPFFC